MSTIIPVGKRQFTAELICEHLSRSPLLPQLLREIIIDEVLSQWQPTSLDRLVDGQVTVEQSEFQISTLEIDRGHQSPIESVAARAVRLEQFKQEIWGNKLGSYYLERKSQLDRVICSVMQVADGSIAQELFFRIQSGKSFAELARRYSQGVAAQDGGRIGPIPIGNLQPDIAVRIVQLEPGEISPLFPLGNTYTFVRLEELVPAQFDDDLRQFLIDELFEEWLQERINREIGLVSFSTDFIPRDFMTNSQRAIEEQTPHGVRLLFPLAPNQQQDTPSEPEPAEFVLERGDTGLLLSQLEAIANPEPAEFVLERGDTGLLLSQLEAIANPAPAEFVLERGDTGLLLSQLEAIANPEAVPELDRMTTINLPPKPETFELEQNTTGLLLSLLDTIADELNVDLADPAAASDITDLSVLELSANETSSSEFSSSFFYPQTAEPAPITYVSDLDRQLESQKWLAILAITLATLLLGVGTVYQLSSTSLTNSIQQPNRK